jgi:UDP-apiose/xylose synthase
MPKIALIGCGGFIGSHFLDAFLADSAWTIEGWDWSSAKIGRHLSNPAFTYHQGDVYSFPGLEEAIGRCDVVIALAAMCNPSQYNVRGVDVIESNFIQPRLIADMCARKGKWLIQFSTSEVYGQTLAHWTGQMGHVGETAHEDFPASMYELDEETSPLLMGPVSGLRWSYACAKQLLERYILALNREHNLPYTIIRPFNFLGTRMDYLPGLEAEGLPRVLACFTAALLDKRPLTLVDGGHARRTFMAVEEAVEALRLMLEQPGMARNKVFNLGHPGNEVTIRGLAELMRDVAAEVSGDEAYLNHPLVDVPALEFYGEGYVDSDRRMPRIDRAVKLLGWAPQKGLRDILRHVLEDAFRSYLSLSAQKAQ